jgi:hypothetical protein
LHYLNINYLLRKGLFCRKKGLGILIKYTEREIEERGWPEEEELTLSSYTRNHVFIFPFD